MKKTNQNKLNESSTEPNNTNNEIKKQNSSFYLHNKLLSLNLLNKNHNNNNLVSPNIIKSFSFIKKIKPKIEENKENRDNKDNKDNKDNHININKIKNQKYPKNQNTHNLQKTNLTKNNTLQIQQLILIVQ